MNTQLLFWMVLVMPAAGGLVSYWARHRWWVLLGVAVAFVLAVGLVMNGGDWIQKWQWLPGFQIGWRLDRLSLALIGLVLFISLLVHLFSLWYMEMREQPRYFLKLGFFTSAMIGLLAADHLVLLFIFWELVGFASYLLIGFWHTDEAPAQSAKWAFMTNRTADVALLAAILALGQSDTFFISELNQSVSFWTGLGLLIGAMGKSAQLPFSAWLPRAMTGPTPVSALIHAATMVAAGVYLLLRVGPYFPDAVLTITTVVGVLTAFYGGFTAVTQHDIKQVLAFSTISQLGFMFLGIGVQAFEASFFHLWTHAFFKAGLFLIAGAVIHHLHTQDMRRMGGLAHPMRWLMVLHVVCSLALAGIPLFSGFMSKEGILTATWQWAETHTLAGFSEAHLVSYVAFFSVFLTAWYIGRHVWLVYLTPSRVGHDVAPLPYTPVMAVPLVVLALLSLWVFHGVHPLHSDGYVVQWVGYAVAVPAFGFLPVVSTALAVIGFVHCYGLFGPRRFYVQHYAELTYPPSIVGRLSYFGAYLDQLYQSLFAQGYLKLARLMAWIDRVVIDGAVKAIGVSGVVMAKVFSLVDTHLIDGAVRGVASLSGGFSWLFTRTQAAQVQRQVAWLLLAVLVLLSILLFFKPA